MEITMENYIETHNDDLLDDEFFYNKWLKTVEEKAEEAVFFRIFDLTRTYPM
jgi:hypothetical protein